MGKACLRFRKLEDLALEVIGEVIRRVPARAFIDYYESVLKTARKRPAQSKARKSATPPKSKTKEPSTRKGSRAANSAGT
jgi:hypothetical protein